MKLNYRLPALLAVCWGLGLVFMLPAASHFRNHADISQVWPVLMFGEVGLLVMCLWAQCCCSRDAWARLLVLVAFAIAIDAGVDLNQARDARQAYEKSSQPLLQDAVAHVEVTKTRFRHNSHKGAHWVSVHKNPANLD
jgi:hypothetical protein